MGFGKMGSSLVKLMSGTPHTVVVVTRTEDQARERQNKLLKALDRSRHCGAITNEEWQTRKDALMFTHHVTDLSSADLVIETVREDVALKKHLWSQVEAVVDEGTALVSNTSSISIEELASGVKHSERFCGLHFFHPIVVIDLVEIISWERNSADFIAFLREFCCSIDRRPIVVRDMPGSVLNWVLVRYYLEALRLLEDGFGPPSRIDELARRSCYVGPCESMDVVGFELTRDYVQQALARKSLLAPFRTSGAESSPSLADTDRIQVPELFFKIVGQGRMGKKASKGIYLYEKGRAVDDEPDFYVDPRKTDARHDDGSPDEVISTRLQYAIFLGTIESLAGGFSSLEELDYGVKEVLQMKTGPFGLMRSLGKRRLREDFDRLVQNFGAEFTYPCLDFLDV